MVSQHLAQSVDPGGLHLEIGDPVWSVAEARQPVDQFGLAQPQAQHPSLRAVETGAGHRNTLVEPFHEMPDQRGAGSADIRSGQAVM